MWRDNKRNVCTRPDCLMALQAERDAEEKQYHQARRARFLREAKKDKTKSTKVRRTKAD